jgi:uncharacterized protein YggL (DUF469 family)
MRKRLRKKQGRGEFTGLAFGVSYVLDDISSQRANEFLDRFVEQAIEANGLECRGAEHHNRDWDFRVVSARGDKPSAEQRAAVRAWLKSRRELSTYTVEEPS